MVESIQVRSEEAVESPEYVEKVLNRFEPPQQQEEPIQQQERPEWLLPKYKTVEDQAKAYRELEKKLGQKQTPQPIKPVMEPIPDNIPTNTGIDFEGMSNEFSNNGSLSEETYKKLESSGIPRHVVDGYIEGQQIKSSMFQQQVMESVGGEEEYNRMVHWAKDALNPREKEAYNLSVNKGTPEQIHLAVLGMYQKFRSFNPQEPNLIQGQQSGSSNFDVYNSTEELKRDMQNPMYKKDPSFRHKVENKLARSNIL